MVNASCRLLLLVCATAAFGQDECSLIVKVLSPDGRELEAYVKVEERNGRIVEKEYVPGGLQFCDLGIFPITVTVGRDRSCNQVVVRNVPISWQKPLTLYVTYYPDPCLVRYPPAPEPGCEILFRISDANGEWVQGATVEIRAPTSATLTADRFGRAWTVSRTQTDIRGAITAHGYESEKFHIRCEFAEKIEHWVVLTAKRARKRNDR
jgi:hypothetical protein